MNIKGQGHSLNFVQGHSDLMFSILFCSVTARPIEAKFHMEPPWDVGNENLFKCSRSHDHAHINYGEKLQKYFSSEPRGRWLWNLVYSIEYSSTNSISYDDLGLTLTILMTGSNLYLNASAWMKAYTALSANVFPSLFWFYISSVLRWAIQDQWSSGFKIISGVVS